MRRLFARLLNIGVLRKRVNVSARPTEAGAYFHVRCVYSGRVINVLLTDHELTEAHQRAARQPEDCK